VNADELTELRAQRFAFLGAVYKACAGGTTKSVHIREIATSLGLDEERADVTATFLRDKGLLEFVAMGPMLAMTHRGSVEFEEGIAAPQTSTDHAPSIVFAENYIAVTSMIDSALQQGTRGSIQTVLQTQDLDQVRAIVADLRTAVEASNLSPADKNEARSDLATLEAEVASSSPKRVIVHESLRSVWRILESSAGTQVAPLAERIVHVIGTLS
jgi:hypothetical protein